MRLAASATSALDVSHGTDDATASREGEGVSPKKAKDEPNPEKAAELMRQAHRRRYLARLAASAQGSTYECPLKGEPIRMRADQALPTQDKWIKAVPARICDKSLVERASRSKRVTGIMSSFSST